MKTGQNIGIVSSERHSLINICRFTISHLLGVAILCGALLFASSSPAQTQLDPQPGLILVNPTPSKGPVVNPYKGWVLYGSVKNQTAAELELASTAYRRFNWSQIQPEEGVFNWKIIDDEIKSWNDAGKQFAFGVMCANSHYNDFWVTPKWVFDAGAMYKTFDLTDPKMATSGTPGLKLVPVFDDPIFMQKLESFIKALAARYDGNPALAFIDIRSYGNWGEGHMYPFSSQNIPVKSYLAHVQIHRDAFKKTQLQLPWGVKGYAPVYKWAVENGIGLRRDGVCGNSDGSELTPCAGLVPGVFEFYADYETMLKLGWWEGKKDSAGRGFKLEECVEKGMPTWCDLSRGGKSGQVLLDSERPLIEKLANRLGYHFVLKGVQFPAVFQPNIPVPINAMWENEGVAPIFVPASIAYALLDSAGNAVKSFPAPNSKPSDWKPAKSVISQDTLNFTDVPPGTYSLAVGILTPNQPQPSIKIAIESESRNGWQILGQVQVQNDTIAPVLNLPSSVPASATSPSGAVVNDTTATAPIVVRATDVANNASQGTFMVKVVADTTAPVLTLPSNVSAAATNAGGATVSYPEASAKDNVTIHPRITYSQDSGTNFPIGVTPVIVTTKDESNNVSSGTFTVAVKDTTAPVLKVPSNITVEATNASGAQVNYSAATATDNVTANPVIVYSKASGGMFPIGSTTVTVTATDEANNVSSADFTVTVKPATPAAADVMAVAGAYQVLLTHDNSSNPSEPCTPGRLTVTLDKKASFSGKLEYFGVSYPLKGVLTSEMTCAQTIVRKGLGRLVVVLELDWAKRELYSRVSESVTNNGVSSAFESAGTLKVQPVYTTKNPASQSGQFTVVFNPRSTLGPLVSGYATANVSPLGTVTLVGMLPDGTAINSAGQIQVDGSLEHYNGLYSAVFPTAGYIAGKVTFDATGGVHSVNGSLEWNKPKQAKGLWKDGFIQLLETEGSVHEAPKAKRLVLGANALQLEAPELGTEKVWVTLTGANTFVVSPQPTGKTILLSLGKDGLVSGTITKQRVGKTPQVVRTLKGVVLQAQREVAGFYLRETDAADWSLTMPGQ
ncbi:MAG: HYR domain-containing protein [Verrucomicrobiota bacterium]